jgi:hypothetical protein
MTLEEDTLWNSTVLNSGLEDVQSIVIKIVINNAFADSVVFVRILNDWFLEVSVEVEYLFK